ncbi:MAG: penicillin-binding protein activator LpoB [Chitinispirillales bacterium]|jgi:hypothetical protein|nr:penicillin-binding protein activator LpoB [Chitinispirillales bacterium]
MKGNRFLIRAALFVSVVMFGVCAAVAEKKPDMSVYGDVIAKAGQSEIVIENTLLTPLSVLVDGREVGNAKPRNNTRFVVADGNHYLKVVGLAKGSGSSKDLQFYTRGKRFIFKVTGPTIQSVYLSRESVYDLGVPPGPPAPGVAVENGGNEPPPLAETSLGKDKAAMFDRLDKQVTPAVAPSSASAAAPAPARTSAAPATPASAAPAQSSAPVVPAGPKFALIDGKKPHIAVYVTGDKTAGEKKALGDKLLTALVNSGKFIAIERSKEFLDEIDNEQRKQREGSVDESQISKLGRQFGVHYVCVANIIEAFGGHQVSARIINVETAVVVAMGEDDSPLRNMDDLASVSFRIARTLLKE